MDALVAVCSWNTDGINYDLGMDALVTLCSWNTNGINYGLGMDALVTLCSWNTNGIMVWAWMLWWPYALGTRTELWFGHGCSGDRVVLVHEMKYGFGMDAPVTVCFWNTNGVMVWAWMLWWPYALGTRTEVRFGHGCCGKTYTIGWMLSWSPRGCSAKNAMRGGSRDFEASEGR